MKRVLLLAIVLCAAAVYAEVGFKSLSVTDASQTFVFPSPAASVLICNYGAGISYHRLFNENETPAASTTSYTPIPAGSATAPVCKSYSKTETQAAYLKAISIICAAAGTATVTVEMN